MFGGIHRRIVLFLLVTAACAAGPGAAVRAQGPDTVGRHSHFEGTLLYSTKPGSGYAEPRLLTSMSYAYFQVPRAYAGTRLTDASHAVIRGSEAHVRVTRGPMYRNGPSSVAAELRGSVPVFKAVALGLVAGYRRSRAPNEQYTLRTTERWIGPALVWYASPRHRITETVTTGVSALNEWNDVYSHAVHRFEHGLDYAGRGYGYTHHLRVDVLGYGRGGLSFEHVFEFPTSESFSLGVEAAYLRETVRYVNLRDFDTIHIGVRLVLIPAPTARLWLAPFLRNHISRTDEAGLFFGARVSF